jgi:hypothetical protein
MLLRDRNIDVNDRACTHTRRGRNEAREREPDVRPDTIVIVHSHRLPPTQPNLVSVSLRLGSLSFQRAVRSTPSLLQDI